MSSALLSFSRFYYIDFYCALTLSRQIATRPQSFD